MKQSPRLKAVPQPQEGKNEAAVDDAAFLHTLPADTGEWTPKMTQEAARRILRITEELKGSVGGLRTLTEGAIRAGEKEENFLLRNYATLFAEASTVKESNLSQKVSRFSYLAGQVVTLGLKQKQLEEEYLGKKSPHTRAVANLIIKAQKELEAEGKPIPQPVSLGKVSFERRDLFDLSHRLASGGISTGVVLLEIGTITTMVLLLAQEIFGTYIMPGSVLHKVILGAVAATLAPVIEYAKGVFFTKTAERKELREMQEKPKKEKKPFKIPFIKSKTPEAREARPQKKKPAKTKLVGRSYPQRVGDSVKKHMRAGALALLTATGVAGVSKGIQGYTLEVGVAMGDDSADLAEQSRHAETQTNAALANFGVQPLSPAEAQDMQHGRHVPIRIDDGPIRRSIHQTGVVMESMLSNEWVGHHVEGQGGREGAHGQGPALAYKAGLVLGSWREDLWGPLSPEWQDAYSRGFHDREALGLTVVDPEHHTHQLTLEQGLDALWVDFLDTVPEPTESDPHPISTRAHIQGLVEDLQTLGFDVQQIPGRGRLDELKIRLGTTNLWPGKGVIYRVRDRALARIAIIEARYRVFTEHANAITNGTADALTREAERMHRDEGAFSIRFADVNFDTSALRSIHIDHAISITDSGPAHARAAEVLTHGTGPLNILFSSLLLYGLASFGVGAIAYGKGRMNRRRFGGLVEKFKTEYAGTTKNEEGYLDELARKISGQFEGLFVSDAGFFGRETMANLTKVIGGKVWARADEETLRIAIAEVMSELSDVEKLDTMNALEGIAHMYVEGIQDVVGRGNPEELEALNAAHRLLNLQSEFSRRIIEKIFPGFFSFEAFLAEHAVSRAKGSGTKEEAMQFDAKLYDVVLGHLERRVAIERTKLAWCQDAFYKFRKKKTFEHLGIGSLAEEPNEANIDLKHCEGFSKTGLKPEKLAGSALSQAAIRTLREKITSAQQQIVDIEAFLKALTQSLDIKAKKLGATENPLYRRIADLRAVVVKAKAFKEHAEEEIQQLTPGGKISSMLHDVVVEKIAERMGAKSNSVENQETPEELRARIENQFNTLIRVAQSKWSWEEYDPKDRFQGLQKQCIDNGAYSMRSDFLVRPKTEDVPVATYGVRFTIDYKGTGANDPSQEVVAIEYSLSSSFSEQKTPAQILEYFREHIDKRANYYAAKVFEHRIEKALIKEQRFDRPRTQEPLTLTDKNIERDVKDYYEDYLVYESTQRHRDSLRGRLNARVRITPASPDDKVEGTKKIDSSHVREWDRVGKELKTLSDEVESYRHPLATPPITREQMNTMISSIQNNPDVRRQGMKIVFDHARDSVSVSTSGFLGIGAKSLTVPVTAFKAAFEGQQNNMVRAVKTLLARPKQPRRR